MDVIHTRLLIYACLHASFGVSESEEKWVDSLKHVARFVKVESGHLTMIMKFDGIGALSFGLKIPSVLSTTATTNYNWERI